METHPDAGFEVASRRFLTLSYADDIKLLCKSREELSACFLAIDEFLLKIGLHCSPAKCQALVIGKQPT